MRCTRQQTYRPEGYAAQEERRLIASGADDEGGIVAVRWAVENAGEQQATQQPVVCGAGIGRGQSVRLLREHPHSLSEDVPEGHGAMREPVDEERFPLTLDEV